VKWLEAAGARVVPVSFRSSQQEFDLILSQLNGLLFPGGDLSLLTNTTFYQSSLYIFQKYVSFSYYYYYYYL
jgi:hypothetical protein